MLTFIIFILVLGILVVVHELGHFWIARRNGVRVDEFGFGFPPKLFGIKRGETLYSFNALPLGGFVKIFGEDMEEGKEDPRSFINKSIGARARILAAGVIMNVILAVVIFSFVSVIGSPEMIDDSNRKYAKDVGVKIISISKNSPAEIAGLKMGDKIAELKTKDSKLKTNNNIEEIQKFISENKGQEVVVTVSRKDEILDIKTTPRVNPPEGEGALGIAMGAVGNVFYPIYIAPIKGAQAAFGIGINFIMAVYSLMKQWIFGADHQVAVELAGFIGIFDLTGEATRLGFIYLLRFIGILSVNLAIINALPIPALDGGRLFFLLIEKIRGTNFRWEKYAHIIGFVILILLMILITYNDVIRKWFSN